MGAKKSRNYYNSHEHDENPLFYNNSYLIEYSQFDEEYCLMPSVISDLNDDLCHSCKYGEGIMLYSNHNCECQLCDKTNSLFVTSIK
jgi:hypothetical protein